MIDVRPHRGVSMQETARRSARRWEIGTAASAQPRAKACRSEGVGVPSIPPRFISASTTDSPSFPARATLPAVAPGVDDSRGQAMLAPSLAHPGVQTLN